MSCPISRPSSQFRASCVSIAAQRVTKAVAKAHLAQRVTKAVTKAQQLALRSLSSALCNSASISSSCVNCCLSLPTCIGPRGGPFEFGTDALRCPKVGPKTARRSDLSLQEGAKGVKLKHVDRTTKDRALQRPVATRRRTEAKVLVSNEIRSSLDSFCPATRGTRVFSARQDSALDCFAKNCQSAVARPDRAVLSTPQVLQPLIQPGGVGETAPAHRRQLESVPHLASRNDMAVEKEKKRKKARENSEKLRAQ